MLYSIHRLLGELKLLDSKINKLTYNSKFIGFKKNSANGDYDTHLPKEDYEKLAKANFDSIMALIRNRNIIKDAIVDSNATTIVEVGGNKYTVASAIERKKSIQYEKDLLETLKEQHHTAIKKVNNHNALMEQNLDEQLNRMLGGENSVKVVDGVKSFADTYRSQNGWELIDPLNLAEKIAMLEEEISDFETEVDYVLSTSNATVTIELDLE